MADDDEKLSADAPEARRRRGRAYAKGIIALVVLGIFLAWVLANDQSVEVNWLVDETTGPLSAILLVAAAVGAVIGALVTILIQRRSRRV